MGPDPLVDIAGELYALPPEEFVAARDEAVKRARASGDRQLAAAIGKLRRPTVGAWLVNRLARERPDMIDEFLELGEALRDAQRHLRGGDLRDLTVRRREMVSRLTGEAVALGRRAYRRTVLPLNEIEATLTAALADPEVADQVRAGLLAKTVERTGFGETPRPQLRLVRGGADPDADPEVAVARSRAGKRALRAAPPEPSVDAGRNSPDSVPQNGPDRPASITERKAEREARQREAAERAEAQRAAAERAAAERAEAELVAAERRAADKAEREAERAKAAALKRARVAVQRELLAARTELAEAEAARVAAERAAKAAKRRVEKATAALNALETGGYR